MRPLALLVALAAAVEAKRFKAMVYRGPALCKKCPGSVALMLESSPQKFQVAYVGPQDGNITKETLRDIDLFAYGGGPDLNAAFAEINSSAAAIREYIASGGRYMGICLGAFLAGHSPGLGVVPPGMDTDSEISQPKAQVTGEQDTVIQVDWTFQSGPRKGEVLKGRWVYFQDGVTIKGLDSDVDDSRILGQYTKSGDVAASLTKYGKGQVGLIGLHPEANKTWYDAYNLTNPDGVQFDIAHDFINATMEGADGSDGTPGSDKPQDKPKDSGASGRPANPLGWVVAGLLKGELLLGLINPALANFA